MVNKNSDFTLAVANLAAAAINANPKLSMEQAVRNAREILRGTSITQQQIDESVQYDKIQCLEDGTWHVMLRRYIKRRFNMTPQQYREKWGLPNDYPFVAPEYTKKRSKIAKKQAWGKNNMKNKLGEPQTKTEKVGNDVRSIADVFKQGRKNVGKLSPKKHLENTFRVTGASLLWLAEYFTRLFDSLIIDNSLLRAMERGFRNKKKDGFIKNNPSLTSHLIYYLVPLLIWAGVITKKFASEKIAENKAKKEAERKEAERCKEIEGTYKEYVERYEEVVPLIISDLVIKEGVKMKDGKHHVYDDETADFLNPGKKTKGNASIGFGSTQLSDGTKVTSNTSPITTEEAYSLAKLHIINKESLFVLYCYDVAFPGVDINTAAELIALTSLTYNSYSSIIEDPDCKNSTERFEFLRNIFKQQGGNITNEQVLEQFKKYPVINPTSFGKLWLYGADKELVADKLGEFLLGNIGIRWRRWLEACVLCGEISPEEILCIPVGGMYEFFKSVGTERENWFTGKGGERKLNKETIKKFKEWIQNPVNANAQSLSAFPKITDFVPEIELKRAMAYKDNLKANEDSYGYKSDRKTLAFDDAIYITYYDEAIKSYKNKNFEDAATKFETMLEEYPKDALLHNDLALTYIKLERYEDAIKHAKKALKIGDKSQYNSACYNLGLAYQLQGKTDKAQEFYERAAKNGNKAAQKALDAIRKQKNQKTAYRSGVQHLHQKNAKSDVFLYGKEHNFKA